MKSIYGRLAIVCVSIFLAVVGASVIYAQSLPDTYSATAVVQFSPRPTPNGGVVGNETVISAAAGYVAYMGSAATIEQVATAVGIEPGQLKSGMTIRLLPGTSTVTVAFESTDAEQTPVPANAMAAAAVERAKDDPVASGSVLSNAAVPFGPSGPPRTFLVLAGLLLALLLAGMAGALLVAYEARRRRTAPAAHQDTTPAEHQDTTPAEHQDTAPAEHQDTTPAEHQDTAPAAHQDTAPAAHQDGRLKWWTQHLMVRGVVHGESWCGQAEPRPWSTHPLASALRSGS